jgi:hypothetical protein
MHTHPDRVPRPKPSTPPPPPDPQGGDTALGMRTWEAAGPRDPLDRLDRRSASCGDQRSAARAEGHHPPAA